MSSIRRSSKEPVNDESAAANRLSSLMAKSPRLATTAVSSDAASIHSTSAANVRLSSPAAVTPSLSMPQIQMSSSNRITADTEAVWRSSAAKRAEKAWATQSEKGTCCKQSKETRRAEQLLRFPVALADDPKFRKFQSNVDRSLATFDSVSEWADFISFLTRLQKTLQGHTGFNVIPRKLVVAKRLWQCLNPALPSGVHQKALDVYEQILSVIGKEGLHRDLHVWSPGLFAFFQFASTSVKPHLLNIFDRYWLPLGEDLRPVAKSMLLALLPGLEEEANEFFDRVLRLLDHVAESISSSFFLQIIWLIIIPAAPVRLAAFNYLARRLPRLGKATLQEAQASIGKDVGLMMRAFIASLHDEALLVRRLTLDLLVTHLPINCAALSRSADLELLVSAATSVVLKRDLSLNRRLYSWLLGPEEETQDDFLVKYSLDVVRRALLNDIDRGAQEPYRVFISLLDKWEIGQPLSNVIILDIMRSLQETKGLLQQDGMGTTAKMLFEVVDPFVLYRQFYFALKKDLAEEGANTVKLLSFVLEYFPVHDDETRQVHLPSLFAGLLHLLVQLVPTSTCNLTAPLNLARRILTLIPPKVFVRVPSTAQTQSNTSELGDDFGEKIELFYSSRDLSSEESTQRFVSFQKTDAASALVQMCAKVTFETMSRPQLATYAPYAVSILQQLLRTMNDSEGADVAAPMGVTAEQPTVEWDAEAWSQSALVFLRRAQREDMIESVSSCMVESSTCRALATPLRLRDRTFVEALVGKLFALLARDTINVHSRVVKLLIALDGITPGRLIEAAITQHLSAEDFAQRTSAFHALGIMWKVLDDQDESTEFLDLPIRQVLDCLRSRQIAERQLAEHWLRSYVRSFVRIVTPFLRQILAIPMTLRAFTQQVGGLQVKGFVYEQPLDSELLCYALSTLVSVIKEGGAACLKTLRATSVRSCRDAEVTALCAQAGLSVNQTVLSLVVEIAARFINTICPKSYAAAMGISIAQLQAEAADLVQFVASRQQLQAPQLDTLKSTLIQRTAKAVADADMLGQNKFLHALHALLHGREGGEDAPPGALPTADLLKLLSVGLAAQENRPALFQWADFTFSILHLMRHSTTDFLVPLANSLCELLREELSELEAVRMHGTRTDISDLELTTLINLGERILNICIEDEPQLKEPATPVTATENGLLGYVTGSRNTADRVEGLQPISALLHRFVDDLRAAWQTCGRHSDTTDPNVGAFASIFSKTKARCRRALERLYRLSPGEVVVALVASGQADADLMELIDLLVQSEQVTVTYVCEVLTGRFGPSADKGKRKQTFPHV